MNKTKWIFYTVIIGLIPIILRTLTYYIIIDTSEYNIFKSSDIIFFGFVLCISNINELELLKVEKEWLKWVTQVNGFSIVALIIYSFFLGMIAVNEFVPDKINLDLIMVGSSLITFTILSISIMAYLNLKNHTYE